MGSPVATLECPQCGKAAAVIEGEECAIRSVRYQPNEIADTLFMTTLFPILLFGFFLGMRHATDSDHVVAVTTIVSRQRNIGSAAWTGIFWGIGHSMTLLSIGGAIILFGIVVPERLGMSLEFCVALMLILLGAFNLRATFRAVENVSARHDGGSFHQHTHRHGDYVHSHHSRTRARRPTATRKKQSHRPNSIAGLAARDFTRRCVRLSSAPSTDWPARPPSLFSSCRSFTIRSGRWLTL